MSKLQNSHFWVEKSFLTLWKVAKLQLIESSIHSNEAINILQTVSHYGRRRQGAYQNLSGDIVRAS